SDIASNYRILEKIADVGMGVVYLAYDQKLGRHVAIKRLHRSALVRTALRERFTREAKAIAALTHPHIVHVYTFGEDHYGPYIVMEYVPGPSDRSPGKAPPHPYTLADHVHGEGPLPLSNALELMGKLCRAVAYAHKCGVIHRDLKPSNILLTEQLEPKIVDFGLARRRSPDEGQLTVPGERMLSLGYGAPEQEMDASLTDERADVYGLGALFYFALTGKNPRYFRESDVPDVLRPILIKALETDRDRRWASAGELVEALERVKAPSTVELPTIKRTWRCKWCDTVNPVAIQYCASCGWDGEEACAECGAETRFGIQFCGECGADAREYESARSLLETLKEQWERKAYESIIENAERISGFKPIGPRGRRLVEQVRQVQDEARKAIVRREKLRDRIAEELAAENYEAARRDIEDYNALANDRAFDKDLATIPSLILARDLRRARHAIEMHDWPYAEREYARLAGQLPPHDEQSRYISRQLRLHRWRNRIGIPLLVGTSLFLLYILSAAPIYRLQERDQPGQFFRPILALYRTQALHGPLETYARLWGSERMFNKPEKAPQPAPPSSTLVPTSPPEPTAVERLTEIQNAYKQALEKIESDYAQRLDAWPQDYLTALRQLQVQMQRAGDFEGWLAVTEELARFESDPAIPESALVTGPASLLNLQLKFRKMEAEIELDRSRKILAAAEKHIGQLTT
ncbi:MAG: serine/threonine-protein kinase, partial [Kiritimatiellia bacterium]